MAKRATKTGNEAAPSFEEAVGRLETIVRDLEDGETGLDESLARYEEGVRLLRRCYEMLERAERKIALLSGVDADGNPITTPVAEGDASGEETSPGRKRRRGDSAETATDREASAEEPGLF